MINLPRVIYNPIIKDTIIFIKTSDETNGEYALFKVELAPGGGNGMHYHLTFTEKFEVLEGQLNVVVGQKRSNRFALVAWIKTRLKLPKKRSNDFSRFSLRGQNATEVATTVLGPGQSALAPLKVQHRFYNASAAPVAFMVELRPARQFEKALRIGYGLAADGKTNARALPTNLWHLALLFEVAETYVPGPPAWMQKAIMGALARIARWLGKHKELEKYL